MQSHGSGHRSLAWIVAVTLLLCALAPTVSRWLASAHGTPLAMMDVCASRAGAQPVLVVGAQLDEPAGKRPVGPVNPVGTMDHCPFCALHAGDLALPATGLALPLLGTLGDVLPELFLASPSPLAVWAAALARAPPLALA